MTNERAIKWLQMYLSRPIKWDNYSDTTKDIRDRAEKEIFEAFRMAFSALRKQIPIEPKMIESKDTWGKYKVPACGTCGALLGDALFCPMCGKKVKWGMTEREKVIKELREVKEWVAEPNKAGSIETDIVLNAVNDALALLKTQELVGANCEHQCNKCKFYEGVHNVMGHAPCSLWKIGGVMWNDYCSRFNLWKESEVE